MSRKKRLIENEVIFRDVNKNMQEFIEEEPGALKTDNVSYYCECSNPDCIERISLTSKEYKDLHKSKKHFVTLVGHEFPEIEKVLHKKNSYQLVEKHLPPPKTEDIDMALKSINQAMTAA